MEENRMLFKKVGMRHTVAEEGINRRCRKEGMDVKYCSRGGNGWKRRMSYRNNVKRHIILHMRLWYSA